MHAAPGARDKADGLVGAVVAFACNVKEYACTAEVFFGVGLGESRLLAARFKSLHFHLGAVHESHGFALREFDFDQDRAASCARVVKFVGDAALVGAALVAHKRPVTCAALRQNEAESVGAESSCGIRSLSLPKGLVT